MVPVRQEPRQASFIAVIGQLDVDRRSAEGIYAANGLTCAEQDDTIRTPGPTARDVRSLSQHGWSAAGDVDSTNLAVLADRADAATVRRPEHGELFFGAWQQTRFGQIQRAKPYAGARSGGRHGDGAAVGRDRDVHRYLARRREQGKAHHRTAAANRSTAHHRSGNGADDESGDGNQRNDAT